MQLNKSEFAENFIVYRHDGDCYGKATAGAIFRYAQQIATEHAEHIGLGDEVYERTHTAYVLAKQALHFDRVPDVDEKLTLITQPERTKRAVNKRITRVLDEAGNEIACMDGRWVLIDTEKRSILRTHPAEFAIWDNDVERELPMRMNKVTGEELVSVGEHTATYSQCDMNGHMNNTRYVDVICDALPWEVWHAYALRDILIFYHKEIPKGESFELFCAKTAELQWYFVGVREGKKCFEAEVNMIERTKQ